MLADLVQSPSVPPAALSHAFPHCAFFFLFRLLFLSSLSSSSFPFTLLLPGFFYCYFSLALKSSHHPLLPHLRPASRTSPSHRELCFTATAHLLDSLNFFLRADPGHQGNCKH